MSQLPNDDNLEHLFVRRIVDLELPQQNDINAMNDINDTEEPGITFFYFC